MEFRNFGGVGVALVTPMRADGSVDEEALRRHVERQVGGGVDFLVPCGTTGESATLSAEEQGSVVRMVGQTADGRLPVMAGAGGNDTARVVDLARAAVEAGADALLSVSPAYNKPGPDGLRAHYGAIAEAVEVGVMLYNVPGRTASNMDPGVVLELAAVENSVGVKEASGELEQIMTLLRERPAGFFVLSGDDSLTLPLIAAGGDGVISVVANQAPKGFSRMVHAALDGDFVRARELHYSLLPLMRANFVETNPVPVKTGLAMLGQLDEHFRLPLTPMNSREHRDELRSALTTAELLPATEPGDE